MDKQVLYLPLMSMLQKRKLLTKRERERKREKGRGVEIWKEMKRRRKTNRQSVVQWNDSQNWHRH